MSKHDENMFGSAAWDTFNNDYDNSGIKENFGPEIESDKIEVVNLFRSLKALHRHCFGWTLTNPVL